MSGGRVVAIADIGSNTLKYSVMRQTHRWRFSVIDSWADTVRLAAGLAESGEIATDRAVRAIASLETADQRAYSMGATVFLAVATEALRRASNGPALLSQIQTRTRWTPRIISGTEEARLTFAGLRRHLASHGSTVIADIGGGSTEVIHAQDAEVTSIHSVPIGSTSMAERWFTSSPPGAAALRSVRDDARVALGSSVRPAQPGVSEDLILSGGNGVYLARVANRLKLDESLRESEFDELLVHLGTLAPEQISNWLSITVERAKVLPAGSAIAAAAADLMQPSTVRVAPSGIRNGLLFQWLREDLGGAALDVIIDEDVPVAE